MRVAIIEDHPLFRDSLRLLLTSAGMTSLWGRCQVAWFVGLGRGGRLAGLAGGLVSLVGVRWCGGGPGAPRPVSCPT